MQKNFGSAHSRLDTRTDPWRLSQTTGWSFAITLCLISRRMVGRMPVSKEMPPRLDQPRFKLEGLNQAGRRLRRVPCHFHA